MVYGGFVFIRFDKPEWRKAMLEFIADDQIPTYLGGSYVPK